MDNDMSIVPVVDGEVVEPASNRPIWVRDRLVALNGEVSNTYLENGYLLKEARDSGYHKIWGYDSFEDAIDDMHHRGVLQYRARSCFYFIKTVEMVDSLRLSPADIQGIGITKLREIAALKSEEDQRRMLAAAPNMSADEVKAETKSIKDKAAGRDVDPLYPWTFLFTKSQHDMLRGKLDHCRVVFGLEDKVSDPYVLELLVADWGS